ncbi:MAG: 5-formyltetrahydrofolate cyclo-ligase [Ruminococcus sp.]
MTDQIAAKKQLRQTMREKRRNLPPAEKQMLDQQMTRQFLSSAFYGTCEQLFCFVSLPQEPDTTTILRQALADGKCVAVPRCLPDKTMQFHRLYPDKDLTAQLKTGTYGVLEPPETLPVVTPDETAHPLCLVPGLAFDRMGGRLGYGAGYYDRFLGMYPFLLKIGYAASIFVTEEVPMEPTDQRLDGIATEYPLEVWNG